jgi:3-oxoacyl-(acyl-carrier-protein) synthase
MKHSIYIKNSSFLESNFGIDEISDRNIDCIGRMCILAVEELYKHIDVKKRDVPVFFGSAYSSLSSLHDFNMVSEMTSPLQVNPSLFPNTVLNSPFCRASIYHGITSPIFNVSYGVSSALVALELAYLHIINSNVDHAIVCAAEESSDFTERIEKKAILSSCGALYLTREKNELEIRGFSKQKNPANYLNSNENSYGCTNIIKTIHDIKIRKRNEQYILFTDISGFETLINLEFNNEVL